MRLPVKHALPLLALVFASACLGGGGARPSKIAAEPANGPAADYPVVVGDPFTVEGVTYTPVDTMNYDAVGYAVAGIDGGTAISAAHRTLPLPSYVEVTALDSGKTILVRIERRGPMSGKALVELSPGAAAQLGLVTQPSQPVRVRRVNPVEPERAQLRTGQAAPARMDTPKSLLGVLMRKLEAQEGIVRPAPLADLTPAPAASSTPEAKPAKPVRPGKVVKQPKPAPTLAAAPAPKPGATPKPAETPKPEPAPKPAVTARPAATPPPKPATQTAKPGQGRFTVRIGTYGNQANAQAAVKKTGGSSAAAGKFWVVTMGPYPSQEQAQAALAKAKAAGYSDARIQRAN